MKELNFTLKFYDSPISDNVVYSFGVTCKDSETAYQIGFACVKQWNKDWYIGIVEENAYERT